MRHVVSLKVNSTNPDGVIASAENKALGSSENACVVANAALSTADPSLNMSVMPLNAALLPDAVVEAVWKIAQEQYERGDYSDPFGLTKQGVRHRLLMALGENPESS